MIRKWQWRGEGDGDGRKIDHQRAACGLPRRSPRVWVAAGGHWENWADRKNGDDHPGLLLGRTPREGEVGEQGIDLATDGVALGPVFPVREPDRVAQTPRYLV